MPRKPLTEEEREQSRKRRLERDRERQRKRRLDPELRAIERGKNTIAKRLSRARSLYNKNERLYLKANNNCNVTSLLVKEEIMKFEEYNRLKKEKEKERQRKRRLNPEFRAKERARNRILKRIARKRNYFTREEVDNNCECCGEPLESDHVCFSNILSVELHEIDVSNYTMKKIDNDS